MSNLVRSTVFGGIYAKSLHRENCTNCEKKCSRKYQKIANQFTIWLERAKKSWARSKKSLVYIKNNLQSHVSAKQEIYWPVLVACALLLFVFASKIAFAEAGGTPNNLPISDNSKLNLIGFEKTPDPVKDSPAIAETAPQEDSNSEIEDLKNDVAGIVKNTPMAAMIDPISEKNRTVAAFIVGIAMKESKFGVYAPHVGGRDCYNYWGLKAGGKTTAGGYTCFSSPEDAVKGVSKTVEKMVAKGVHTPAQAISWKCGSSCAGHGAENVRKWISDVAINFNKINS
jgi:hypothetical protein